MCSKGQYGHRRVTLARAPGYERGISENGFGKQALELHVQDNAIVKVTSPADHDVTRGNLCAKGRFGFEHVRP